MTTPDGAHLDLDALADLLATEDRDAAGAAHLDSCADCRAALDELRSAQAQVTADLAALPAVPMPADLAARLHDALRDAAADARSDDEADTTEAAASGPATVTTLPSAASRSPMRWLPAAAAALVLLAGAAFGISQLAGGSGGGESAGSAAGAKAASTPKLNLIRNSSGTDYTDRSSLSAALPDLLAGKRAAQDSATTQNAPTQNAPAPNAPVHGAAPNTMAAADPLARLRSNAGLADCLVALLPPDDPSVQPLALDYASYKGSPAMVVVLPGAESNKLDIYVVGPGCSQANDSLVFYTSVDKP